MKKRLSFLLFLCLCLTQANAQAVILSEDFESGTPPAGWTTSANTPSVGWEFGPSLGSSYFAIPAHTRYAASNDDKYDNQAATQNDASMDYLMSPSMDLTPYAASGVVMEFQYVQPGSYGSIGTVEVSTDGGSTWNVVETLANESNWAEGAVNLSAYTNSSTVMIAFHHDDDGNWADGFAIDDVLIREVPAYDLSVDEISNSTYLLTGNHNIVGTITNNGFNTITSFDLHYTVNGGTAVTQNVSGVSIALGSTYNFSHTTPANFPTSDVYSVEVTVDNLNTGNTDDQPADNVMDKDLNTLSLAPVKQTILTDHTGSWCGYCPDGTVRMEDILSTRENVIGVAVHNSDAMEFTEGATLNSTYISGYPSGMVDMYMFSDQNEVALNRGLWDTKVVERQGMLVPAAVSITASTYDATTRAISVTVQADFFGPAAGDFRLNAWILEDSVTGSGSGYDQTNYYNTDASHPYYQAGNPIVGFVHNHTLRAMMGGTWGNSGVVPATVKNGDSYTETFTWTLPAGYDDSKIKVVGLIQHYGADISDRAIMNSVEAELGSVLLDRVDEQASILQVYPNPFTASTSIEFALQANSEVSVDVYDLYGKQVQNLAAGAMNQGIHTINWDGTVKQGGQAAGGMYLIVVSANGQRTTQKVMLSR